jgi:hypothetical protein
MNDLAALPFALWLFTVLLIGRVVGQLIVVRHAPRWLPPMAQWQSGLVPYPALLTVQAVVVSLMIWISIDVSRGAGYWVEPHPQLGLVVLWWSYLYAGAMAVRYIVRMKRRPDQRWLGGTIPIVFHTVVAAFQWTFAIYHLTPR